MPSKTAKQARAMQVAAHGKSNIGIPKSVGKEFVKADTGKPMPAPPAKPAPGKVKMPPPKVAAGKPTFTGKPVGAAPKGKASPSKAKTPPLAPSPLPNVTGGPQAGDVDPNSLAAMFVKRVYSPGGKP